MRDPALGWTVWPSGQSDSKHITQEAWLSEHQCLKQQDSFPLQWPVVQIQRHTRPRRGCRDAVPPPHPGGRSLAGGATRTQNYLSNLCDARTLDTLMEQATEGDWISLDLHHVPGDGAWRTQLATLQLGRRPHPYRLASPPSHLLSPPGQRPLCGQVLDRFCDHAATTDTMRSHTHLSLFQVIDRFL